MGPWLLDMLGVAIERWPLVLGGIVAVVLIVKYVL